MAELVRNKEIEEISDLRDESDRDGMRVVVELKKDAVAEVVLNNLYKQTQMQTSFGVQLLAIVQNRPRTMNLKELLEEFLAFRKEVVTKRTLFLLRKAEAREHILLGLSIALDHLDAVIRLIRASKDPKEAKEGLMAKFGLSEIQAQAILDMRLQRLTGLEREKILQELKEVRAEIARLKKILGEESELLRVIGQEFREIRDAYGDARRSEWTRRWWSPSRTRGTSSGTRSASTGRSGAGGAGKLAWGRRRRISSRCSSSPRCTPTSSSSRTRGKCTG
jgi:DNA gyrase subunit A